MVMGDDSCSKGLGFKSQRHILDGHFFTLICYKNCIFCLKRPKINGKEAGVSPCSHVRNFPIKRFIDLEIFLSLAILKIIVKWPSRAFFQCGHLLP